MARRVLVHTGPIVALLDRRDTHHEWAKEQVAGLHDPLMTCEAVISEAFFLLATIRDGVATMTGILRDGLIKVDADFRIVSTPPPSSIISSATVICRWLSLMPASSE